jgi:predicted GNAT family acetyltransferase
MEQVAVRHEPARRRFAADVAGGQAELAYTGPREGVVTFIHTEVPSAARGSGVGDALARAGLDWARAEGLWVRPVCPFVKVFIRRHPEYADLVEAGG